MAPPAPRPDAWGGVECARVLACVGIVAFHMHVSGYRVAYGGLPVFAILMVALAARSARRGGSFARFARARAARLLTPWVFWSLAYAGIKTAIELRHGRPPFGWAHAGMLLTGSSLHLWYLPFALAATVLVGAAVIRAGAARGGPAEPGWRLWLAAGAALLVASAVLRDTIELGPPLRQWIFIAPTVPLGMALAGIGAGADAARGRLAVFAGAILAACLAAALAGYGLRVIAYAVAAVGCAAAWGIPWRAGAAVLALSGLSFGVYLLHPFFMLVVHQQAPAHAYAWTGVAMVTAMSAAATAVIRCTPLRTVV